MKNLCLKVEVVAGAVLQDAAAELCALADKLGLLCEADFNGVAMYAMPGDSAKNLANKVH